MSAVLKLILILNQKTFIYIDFYSDTIKFGSKKTTKIYLLYKSGCLNLIFIYVDKIISIKRKLDLVYS